MEILQNTPWYANMIDVNLCGVLAAQFLDNGRIAIIRSKSRRERDYDIALSVGLYSIYGQASANSKDDLL